MNGIARISLPTFYAGAHSFGACSVRRIAVIRASLFGAVDTCKFVIAVASAVEAFTLTTASVRAPADRAIESGVPISA